MLVIDKLAQLRNHVDIGGMGILEELTLLLAPYNYLAAYDNLLGYDPATQTDEFLSALRLVELALIDHYNPVPGTENTAKTDIKRFTALARTAAQREEWEYLAEHLELFPGLFDPSGKTVCGRILNSCKNPECGEKFMDAEATYCKDCGEMRRMCRNGLGSSGVETRCRYHKGRQELTGLTGRAKMYASVMNDVDRTIFEDGVLSSDLDMTAEIALIARRISGLVDGVKVDPKTMARAINQRMKRVNKTYAEMGELDPVEQEDEFRSAHANFMNAIDSLMGALESAQEDDSRWREIVGTVNQLRPVIREQRETIVQERNMITADKMRELIALTTAQFRHAVMGASKDVMVHLIGRMQDLGDADFSRMLEAQILSNEDFGDGSYLARRMLGETQKRIAEDRQLQKRVS
jgi:hypothetical protein